jgi:hypothetical protein
MEWMTELLDTVPGAAKYRAALLRLATEHAALERENAGLKQELACYIERWETLDGDAVRTLRYLGLGRYDGAEAIAREHGMNLQISEMYLQFLVKHAYVAMAANEGYGLTLKGRRYLTERGLLG